MQKLNFGKANAKLIELEKIVGGKVFTFSLLAGHTCPQANECHSKVVDGRIVDGPHMKFRCFSASTEVLFTSVYNSRKHNMNAIMECRNSVSDMTSLICNSLPKKAKVIRIHVSGDFFNRNYMEAWCNVASLNRHITFYAYTKSIGMWIMLKQKGVIPDNLILTASYGGKQDNLISEYGLRYAKVVFSEEEADMMGLEVDHNDSHACLPSMKNQSFALMIHGIQKAGTKASKAKFKALGRGGYSKLGYGRK